MEQEIDRLIQNYMAKIRACDAESVNSVGADRAYTSTMNQGKVLAYYEAVTNLLHLKNVYISESARLNHSLDLLNEEIMKLDANYKKVIFE